MKFLVLNAGSSSYKSSLFDSPHLNPIWEGTLDLDACQISHRTAQGKEIVNVQGKSLSEAVKTLITSLWESSHPVIDNIDAIHCVGHRIVNGGPHFWQPEWITTEVKEAIRQLCPLAPLHNPANLKGIEILTDLLPHAKHIAVFDTAFHHTLPEAHKTYAIPHAWRQMGIYRYGYHGISHAYCTQQAEHLLSREIQSLKMICCHLGNGSSLTAIQEGKSLDTTMGFTPLEGLIMGTRSGTIDPGILLFLLNEKGITAHTLQDQLNFASGLKAICGTSDMRKVMALKSEGDPQASLAYDMLAHSLCRHVGAMIGSLGGLDVLIFTGGIGENIPELRAHVCTRLQAFGIDLDEEKNREGRLDSVISQPHSKVRILIIHTREDLAIFQACLKLIHRHQN
jgi:acetate kinase